MYILARLCPAKTTQNPAKGHHLPPYRARVEDSMYHTTKITILYRYYNKNQLSLEPSDKTAKVPHMAARGAG